MHYLPLIGAILVSAPATGQTRSGTTADPNALPRATYNVVQQQNAPGQPASNPWDIVPPTTPYRHIADEIKAAAKPGQPSPLNPSCEGKNRRRMRSQRGAAEPLRVAPRGPVTESNYTWGRMSAFHPKLTLAPSRRQTSRKRFMVRH